MNASALGARGLLLALLLPALLPGQGITAAAIEGRVTREDGAPVEGAIVEVVNQSNGSHWRYVTQRGGRYLLEDVGIGGPYRIAVRAIGYVPQAKENVSLSLGQRLSTSFVLERSAVQLTPVVTTAREEALDAGRAGPVEVFSREQIATTPNLGRDFFSITRLSPQVALSPSSGNAQTGGVVVGGQNRLLNSFQVDGSARQDLYTGRLAGRDVLPRPISLEALEELQVLTAPFDVRYGSFAGGAINAVTRAGTNTPRWSVFGTMQDDELAGAGITGQLTGISNRQFGGTFGGPLVRDRLHLFASVDVLRRSSVDTRSIVRPDIVVDPTIPTYQEVTRFQAILRDTFGLDPGTIGPVTGPIRSHDLFAKLSAQLSANNHVDLAHHVAGGERFNFGGGRARLYVLSSVSGTSNASAVSTTVDWKSLIAGRISHQLVVGRLALDDRCRPTATYPAIMVNEGQNALWAGPVAACGNSDISQRLYEITDNTTLGLGSHVLTAGVHGEALRVTDVLAGNATGQWNFESLAAFAAGTAVRYTRTFPGSEGQRAVSVRANHLSAYVQDRWSLGDRVVLTFGARMDLPHLPRRIGTDSVLWSALGFDTGDLPFGKPVWSPRGGFNVDLAGAGRTHLRGGVGLFAGRPPYAWLANLYRDNGGVERFLRCDNPPPFDPVNQPTSCPPAPFTVRRSSFDPSLSLPQVLKSALGLDHRLGEHAELTLDLLHSRTLHQLDLTDANLAGIQGYAAGEANRPLYGTIPATGRARVTRRVANVGQVVRISDASGDEALSASAQLRAQLTRNLDASAWYTFSRSRDRMSLVNYPARQNLEHQPYIESMDDRPLSTSLFDTPHRVQLSASATLPLGTRVTLLYSGSSGSPYTYVVTGDANADNIPTANTTSDPVYVPSNPVPGGDISLVEYDRALDDTVPAYDTTYARLAALIQSEPCLRAARGRVLTRNACRNSWWGALNARLSRRFRAGGHSLDFAADVYNVPNLVNRRWGLYRATTPSPVWPLLTLARYDTTAQRGIYVLTPSEPRRVSDHGDRWSRWLVELSVRIEQ